MNRTEHLLTILGEECNETAQRASKAIRFSLMEVQPGQPLNNAERIVEEFSQLTAVMEMLYNEGLIPNIINQNEKKNKKDAVEKWLLHSKENGTLTE